MGHRPLAPRNIWQQSTSRAGSSTCYWLLRLRTCGKRRKRFSSCVRGSLRTVSLYRYRGCSAQLSSPTLRGSLRMGPGSRPGVGHPICTGSAQRASSSRITLVVPNPHRCLSYRALGNSRKTSASKCWPAMRSILDFFHRKGRWLRLVVFLTS